MKSVVFGGSGFLGSHVADALSEKGYDVFIYDVSESKFLKENQQMIVGDILDTQKVRAAVSGADYVYNFAGISDIDVASGQPLKTIEINILGNTNIMEACRDNKSLKRFIFASTVYVYSDLAPFYRSSKQSCELIIEDYQKRYGIDYTVLRYGSLYGNRANEFNFIFRSIKQAIEEGKITRSGDGEEIRDYINVLDAAKCSVDILTAEFKNQHVILTGTQSSKVKDFLVMIKEIFNNKIDIEYLDGTNSHHYEITPYSFRPRVAKKFVANCYYDLGQGILDVIYDVYERCQENGSIMVDIKKQLDS